MRLNLQLFISLTDEVTVHGCALRSVFKEAAGKIGQNMDWVPLEYLDCLFVPENGLGTCLCSQCLKLSLKPQMENT